MLGVKFATGIPLWPDLGAGGAYQWLLATAAWTPDPTSDTVRADMTAFEPTDGSYAPQPLTGASETVDVPLNLVTYNAAEPVFAALAGGDILAWAVISADTGSDVTDVLVVAYPIVRLTDGSDVTIGITGGLAVFPGTP